MARQKTPRLAISLLGYLPPTFLRPYPEAQAPFPEAVSRSQPPSRPSPALPPRLLSRDLLRVSLARTPRSRVLASPKPFPVQVAIGPTRFAFVEALLLGQCSTQAALLLRNAAGRLHFPACPAKGRRTQAASSTWLLTMASLCCGRLSGGLVWFGTCLWQGNRLSTSTCKKSNL